MYYDSINFYLPSDRVINTDLYSETPQYLDVAYSPNNNNYINGKCGNYKVGIAQSGVSLQGSMAKYLHGSNVKPLPYSEVKEGVEMLSDKLHLPLNKAKVSRFDVAQNLIMEEKPEAYFPYLGEMRYFKRNSGFAHTLYYRGKEITIAFYNKGKEAKYDLPTELKGKNILRCELRYMKTPYKHFNLPEVTPSLLSDEVFSRGLVNDFQKQYNAISKDRQVYEIPNSPISPRDVMKIFALQGIRQTGDLKEALEYISNVKFKDKAYPSRAKRIAKGLFAHDNFTFREPLIRELDEKMNVQFQELLAA